MSRHDCGGPLSYEGPCGGCERCIPRIDADDAEPTDDGPDWDFIRDRERDERREVER